jgi:hypothetical protein
MCYEVDRQPFATISGISLSNDFSNASTVDVRRLKRLCAPASKNDEDPQAPLLPEHLAGYSIIRSDPRFQTHFSQEVTNQFGTITMDVVRPDLLMVPTAKSLSGSPDAPTDSTIDHFECYQVKRARQRVTGVKVQDQFGTFTYDLKRPVRLCVATDKNGEGIPIPGGQLLCYEVRPPRNPRFHGPSPIFINNQFVPLTIALTRPTELCVPSLVAPPVQECGNGIIEGSEICDTNPCPDQQPCSAECTCPPPLCGNGTVDNGEACDPAIGGTPCPGALACNSDCTCPLCGNGTVDNGEACDPAIGGAPCPGELPCNSDCTCPD